MPISQCVVTGSFRTPTDTKAKLSSVKFRLSGTDSEAGEYIVAKDEMATIDHNTGMFRIALWPNDRGLNGDTTYEVRLSFTNGSSVASLKNLYIRHSDEPQNIADIAFEMKVTEAVKPFGLVITNAQKFDETEQKKPNTIYLIEK